MLAVFALTLFISATLLFLVQPIIGKMITPLLGGSPAVWNTCMVFFQVALLAGYGYAHASIAWLGARRQAALHLALLLTPFAFFALNYLTLGRPLAVSRTVIDGSLNNPIPQLLLLLVVSVGVPFFVISTSAPLLQKWFTSTKHPEARDPYFLYGASNLGSMLALLGYPTLVEPYLPVGFQTWSWMVGYAVLVLLVGGSAMFLWQSPAAAPEPAPVPEVAGAALARAGNSELGVLSEKQLSSPLRVPSSQFREVGVARGRGKGRKRGDRPPRRGELDEPQDLPLPEELTGEVTWLRRLRWVVLAAVPSSLMLGATTYMTTDIAAIPLLWVLPLALYLLSFIIVFSKVPPVVHKIFVLALPLILLLLSFMMLSDIKPPRLVYTLGIHLLAMFVVSMVCHGELARNRPAPMHLTEFFLWMSFGGVVGGMFNALVAPVIFSGVVEYQLAMVVACLLLPPLGLTGDTRFGYFADLALMGLCLTVGSVLIGVRLWDNTVDFPQLEHGMYFWMAAAVVLMLALGLFAVFRVRADAPEDPVFAYAVPLGLLLGTLALNIVGVWAVYLLAPKRADGGEELPQWSYWVARVGLVLVLVAADAVAVFLYRRRAGDPRLRAALDEVPRPAALGLVVALNAVGLALLWCLWTPGTAPRGWVLAPLVAALVLVCAAVNAAAAYLLYTLRTSDKRLQTWLDVALPLAVLLFAVGLVWGLRSRALNPSLQNFSVKVLDQPADQVRIILTFGVPAVLCYTFVERSLRFGLSVGALLLAGAFTATFDDSVIFQERSFFGVLRVEAQPPNVYEGPAARRLVHGTTLHGRQYLPLPEEVYQKYPDLRGCETWPLTYYHRTGPIGQVCATYNPPVRDGEPAPNIGVIGLGTGTMACYAQKGQRITFYDIDPVVRKITYDTDDYFTFLKQARERGAVVNLVMGDARLKMERERPSEAEKYRILVVDAFSSDAIPIHLITFEALAMYLEHMTEDGLVCFHVSNRYLNLKPVLGNLAAKYRRERGPLVAYYMEDPETPAEPGKAGSTWVVLARSRKYLTELRLADEWDKSVGLTEDFNPEEPRRNWDAMRPALEALGVQAVRLEPRWFPAPVQPSVGDWTDDYASLWGVFGW
jgi:hypothetical protein